MPNKGQPANPVKPEIFVVVPSYQHSAFVGRTLRSIFRQTLEPRKLLVIDDGSNDGSPALIEKELAHCPFDCELIVRENRGLCRTLNEALDLSFGDFFAYISSDDIWLPEFLESRTGTLEARPEAVLSYGYSYLIDDRDEIFDVTSNWAEYVDGNAAQMLLTPIIPASASVLYRRDALKESRWFEDAVLEDYDLYLRLSAMGEFALDRKTLSAWRIHGANTSADSALMMDEWLRAQTRVRQDLGLSEDQLTVIQRKVKFGAIPTLARNGQRKRAAELLRETGGSFSALERAKAALRIAMPVPVYRLIRWIRKWQAKGRYPSLQA
ncbi:MAG TPA: glycosyltransferase family A protein [Pyrinomonadaceae bacterium]|nr:glycosyltransferase family A protein [Pyrinomonadaceae bacterium]